LSELAQKHKLQGSWGDPAVITPLLDEACDFALPSKSCIVSWQQVIEDNGTKSRLSLSARLVDCALIADACVLVVVGFMAVGCLFHGKI